MPKLEDVLKAKGFTDQEITDMAPMLSNAKFRATLEAELTDRDTRIQAVEKDLNEYDRWFTQEITPKHEELVAKNRELEAEAAAAKARAEAYQKSTMRQQGNQQSEEERLRQEQEALKQQQQPTFDPNKYVTADTFKQGFEQVGEAVASAMDIASDHMQLFPGQYLNMSQLRLDARAARKPVRQYWEEKYKVTEKRQQMADAAIQERIDAAVKAKEQELMVTFGGSNPNMNALRPSNNPFVIRKSASAGAQNKQPWEITEAERSRARIEKGIQAAAKRGELASV